MKKDSIGRNLRTQKVLNIALQSGGKMKIRTSDWPLVCNYRFWRVKLGGKIYAFGWDPITKKKGFAHRLITRAKKGQIVDHINGDGLDNRADNLRLVKHSVNSQNRTKMKGSQCKYIGVIAETHRTRLFRAALMINGKKIYKCGFESAIEAAKAYDRLAKEHYGRLAMTNRKMKLL